MKRNGKLCEIDLFPVVLNEPVPSFLLASVCDMIELVDFQISSHLAKRLEHRSNRLLDYYPQISRFNEFRNSRNHYFPTQILATNAYIANIKINPWKFQNEKEKKMLRPNKFTKKLQNLCVHFLSVAYYDI